jgi:hypothetical protein
MAWEHPALEQKAKIVRLIGRNHPAFRRDPERCSIDTLNLPFYPGGKLARLTAQNIPDSVLWYVCLPEESVALTGGFFAIDHCNAAAPLTINHSTIFAYIKFRYYFGAGSRLFEARIKRSAVGYSGKIWLFEGNDFLEIDINISPRDILTELEKTVMTDVPNFAPALFDL